VLSLSGSERIAELIGAILGDGNIYDKRPHYVEFCGNPVNDLLYYERVLLPIVREELGKYPRLFVRYGGLRFRINQRSFVDWLKQQGIPAGEAKGSASFPDFIVSSRKLLPRCIRGIYDTDGSVYFDRRPAYVRPYPRVDLHMTNACLLEQLSRFLDEYGIKHSFVRSKGSLETAGVESLKLFLQKVGFSNPYHISRIEREYPEILDGL
jgi:intein/homing endonuclease